jgi:integrase
MTKRAAGSGSITLRRRGEGDKPDVWELRADLGYERNALGGRERRQRSKTFRGTRKEAEEALRSLLTDIGRDEDVKPTNESLIDWMRSWLEVSVKPPMKRQSTYVSYRNVVQHLAKNEALAFLALQKVRSSHLEQHLMLVPAGSRQQHRNVFHAALKKAVKDKKLATNPAVDLEISTTERQDDDMAINPAMCWNATEASQFLVAAKTQSPQVYAWSALALDSGARKNEIAGLHWPDVDLDGGSIFIRQQLLPGLAIPPRLGPTKTGKSRRVSLNAETVAALRAHRRHQLELKLANGEHYRDWSLVFAREDVDLRPGSKLGDPIRTLSERTFQKVMDIAKLRHIAPHYLRHTSATLLLLNNEAPTVVAGRLGHSVDMLLRVYRHVLPEQDRGAADRLGATIHRR